MTLSFECMQCEADFEHDIAELIQDPTLTCPNCGAKSNPDIVEAAAMALDEAIILLGRLRRRFRFELSLDSDDLDLEEDDFIEEEDELWANDIEDDEEDVD